jgi:hypothetical protein
MVWTSATDRLRTGTVRQSALAHDGISSGKHRREVYRSGLRPPIYRCNGAHGQRSAVRGRGDVEPALKTKLANEALQPAPGAVPRNDRDVVLALIRLLTLFHEGGQPTKAGQAWLAASPGRDA